MAERKAQREHLFGCTHHGDSVYAIKSFPSCSLHTQSGSGVACNSGGLHGESSPMSYTLLTWLILVPPKPNVPTLCQVLKNVKYMMSAGT